MPRPVPTIVRSITGLQVCVLKSGLLLTTQTHIDKRKPPISTGKLMRSTWLLLFAGVLPSAGCSLLVVNTGKNLAELKSQEQVHETFGLPSLTGQTEGVPYEEFTTHRKIAEPDKNIYIIMGTAGTFGFGELVWFPTELYRAIRRSVVGQQIRYIYDAEGNVTDISHDGESVSVPPRYSGDAAGNVSVTKTDAQGNLTTTHLSGPLLSPPPSDDRSSSEK